MTSLIGNAGEMSPLISLNTWEHLTIIWRSVLSLLRSCLPPRRDPIIGSLAWGKANDNYNARHKKAAPCYFCNTFVKTLSIMTIFGTHILYSTFFIYSETGNQLKFHKYSRPEHSVHADLFLDAC